MATALATLAYLPPHDPRVSSTDGSRAIVCCSTGQTREQPGIGNAEKTFTLKTIRPCTLLVRDREIPRFARHRFSKTKVFLLPRDKEHMSRVFCLV